MTLAMATASMSQLESGVFHLSGLPSFSSSLGQNATTATFGFTATTATPVEEGSPLAMTTYKPIDMGLLAKAAIYQKTAGIAKTGPTLSSGD